MEAQDVELLYGWGLLGLFQSCRGCEEVQEEEEEGQEKKVRGTREIKRSAISYQMAYLLLWGW